MGLKREYMSMNLYQRGKHRKLLPLQLLPVSSSRTWYPEEGRHGHGSHNSSAAGDSLLHTPADSRSTTPSRSTFTSVESSCEDFGRRKDVRKDWGRGHLCGAGACLGGGAGSGGGGGGCSGGGGGGGGCSGGNCGAGGSGGAPIGLAVGLGGGGADSYASSFDYNAFDPNAFLPPPPPPPLRRDLSFSEELAAALEKASYEGHLEDEEVDRTPWSEADDEADLEADRLRMYNAPAEVSDFPTYLAPACSVTAPRSVLRHNTVEACTGAASSAARGTSAASAAAAAAAAAEGQGLARGGNVAHLAAAVAHIRGTVLDKVLALSAAPPTDVADGRQRRRHRLPARCCDVARLAAAIADIGWAILDEVLFLRAAPLAYIACARLLAAPLSSSVVRPIRRWSRRRSRRIVRSVRRIVRPVRRIVRPVRRIVRPVRRIVRPVRRIVHLRRRRRRIPVVPSLRWRRRIRP